MTKHGCMVVTSKPKCNYRNGSEAKTEKSTPSSVKREGFVHFNYNGVVSSSRKRSYGRKVILPSDYAGATQDGLNG